MRVVQLYQVTVQVTGVSSGFQFGKNEHPLKSNINPHVAPSMRIVKA